jgi:predicted solute-binding protein
MSSKLRVSAVSFLNTQPLVWGFLHGPQRDRIDLRFDLPAECADLLSSGAVEVGIAPSIELGRQSDLLVIPGCSISSWGPVTSILLVCRRPIEELESVAVDTSSRSSAALTQIVLARKYHRYVKLRPYPPRLPEMLEIADAAMVIGDPALRYQRPAGGSPLWVYDLGEEWDSLTGLPMVYAVWMVRRAAADPGLAAMFQASARYGQARVEEIVAAEAAPRGLALERACDYLRSRIHYGWGEAESRGLSLFLEYAAELGLTPHKPAVEMLAEPALAV